MLSTNKVVVDVVVALCDILLTMIGCYDCFGFGFTTLNRKVLYREFSFMVRTKRTTKFGLTFYEARSVNCQSI